MNFLKEHSFDIMSENYLPGNEDFLQCFILKVLEIFIVHLYFQ